MNSQKTLVLHSGGQDSTTCLVWAMKKFKEVCAIGFDYGQRHKTELRAARTICKKLKVPFEVIKIQLLAQLTRNALTDQSIKIQSNSPNPEFNPSSSPYLPLGLESIPANKRRINPPLPSTFVDGRNAVFLLTAAIYAKQRSIDNLVTGVCQTDYSGYPDCREEFIQSMQKTLRLAMLFPFQIHTPLMFLTKAETVKLMERLSGLELLKYTHTCYAGTRPACGKCPACVLRLKGFREAGVRDGIEYSP